MSKKLLLVTKMDDDNYNLFKFDTSLTPEDKTVTLATDRRGDNTSWDGITDWGDGTLDTNTTHTYTNNGVYLVKTKYILDESNNRNNNTRKKLIDCININNNMTDVSFIFKNCINVVEFSSTKWNTKNIINALAMFSSCTKLTTLDLSKCDASNITNMNSMFNECKSITTLDISNFNTNKVTDMDYMFYVCSKLTTLNISNFNMDNVTTYVNMFTNCTSLYQSGLTMTNCNEATKTKINSMVKA